MNTKLLDSIPITLSEKPLLDHIGFENNNTVSIRLEKNIENAVDKIQRYAEAKAIYKEVSIRNNNGAITLDTGMAFKSKILSKVLSSCNKAVVFLVTIGNKIDKVVKQNLKRRSYSGFILDAAASVAVESAVQHFQSYVDNSFTQNEKTTLRYSPGYCDWPIQEQQKLFKILPSEKIDVELSNNCLMSPRKTISGIIGVCTDDCELFYRNACSKCGKTNCQFRRTI